MFPPESEDSLNDERHLSPFNLLSAIFLVAGTCIGGGMLALPVATGLNGLFPSLIIMALCWAAMTATALCFVEASLWLKEGAHVITMSSQLLGPLGKGIAWCLYLFISYASIVAYTAGGGLQIHHVLHEHFGLNLSFEISAALFLALFGFILYLGSAIVGRVNAILFTAMIAAYIGLFSIGASEINPSFLLRNEWRASYLSIPLLLTSFSFQTLVPSLTPYLKRNVQALRIAIIAGTSVTFLIYACWQLLVLGIVPLEGNYGLEQAFIKGEPATTCLYFHTCTAWVSSLAEYFAFFAIVTSFFGMALGLFDFLADGCRIKKEGIGRILLSFMILIPTYFFATYFERIFLIALDTTGGFGDSILNGIIPLLMVWIGRYRLRYEGPRLIPGGRIFLGLLMIFYGSTLLLSIGVRLGWIPTAI